MSSKKYTAGEVVVDSFRGDLGVRLVGKMLFLGNESCYVDYSDETSLFETYDDAVSNTAPRERLVHYLKRAKRLQRLLARSIKDMEWLIKKFDEGAAVYSKEKS